MKLEVKDIIFSYKSRPVLESVTLKATEGNVTSLVGPNGSGKTTLIKCINRILKPKVGTVLVEGEDVGKVKLRGLAKLLGYVPQSAGHVFPSTVFDAVLLGRRPYVNWRISSRDKEVVSQMLSLMGLGEMALRQFNQLSGGEQQKILIARALAQEPQVLLLDEPTSNLDLRHQLEVLSIVRAIVNERGITAIMAIHDLNLAARFSDTLVFLDKGRIYDAGKPSQVLTQENIKNVYGVEAIVSKNLGHPHIIPLAPIPSKGNN